MKAASGRPVVEMLDTSLRDGSHAVAHSFTAKQVAETVAALAAAGVGAIEVSHGDGLGGSTFNYGFSAVDEIKLIEAAVGAAGSARIAVLLLPGIGTSRDLRRAASLGVQIARIATHCTEADIAIEHIEVARELDLRTVGFLMLSHMVSPEELAEQALVFAAAGIECVYVVDSAGALLPDGVAARVAALREALDPAIDVGFHAHNNLGLGVGNSLAAVAAGANRIDGSACGLGAGAGNAATEQLVAAFGRAGIETGVDLIGILAAAEDVVRPMMERPQLVDREAIILGVAGVYSSFLLHARRAAERYDVPAHDLLIEAGRRGYVGGQEDMLVDVAVGMANRAVEE